MSNINSPFLMYSHHHFQTNDRVYFVMPFMKGGDLYEYLRKKSLSLEQIKYIAAQVAVGLNSLHESGIIYRDLRPENVLLEESGYIRLADFGISKYINISEHTMTFCGASEYLSPEIILGKGYDKKHDWWAMGVFLFELVYGFPPFFDESTERLYDLICHTEIEFPNKEQKTFLLSDIKDLISQLLHKDPNRRLGAKEGLAEIKSHPFMKNIDFEYLTGKRINTGLCPCDGSANNFKLNESEVLVKKNNPCNEVSEKELEELTINFSEEFTNGDLNMSFIGEKGKELIHSSESLFATFHSK
mmetsp:Transcript_23618/g.24589  ORF Transcript_23618/g.24589 Transcript_23618/m.24589 type:complete len:301 (+) Transcript_23618:3-905(+)